MTLQVNDLDHRDATHVVGSYNKTGSGVPNPYRVFGKRMLDILLVGMAAPFVVPLVIVMAVMVALDGHNPFYLQERVGRNGRVFRIFKLRTMVPNAKAHLKTYLSRNAEARAEWEETQKLRNDPRVTRIGQILRATSLDELPQLLNVLKGDMSLVGPRPMMVEQTDLYPGSAYYKLRPGISGSWQVSDRNGTTFAARATYDTEYYQSMSLWLDLKIMVLTVVVVLRGTGC